MIIHHQQGHKSSVLGLVKTVRTESGMILMCYDDPITKAKGIVEIHPNEVQAIIAALSGEAKSDVAVMKAFAGIRPAPRKR